MASVRSRADHHAHERAWSALHRGRSLGDLARGLGRGRRGRDRGVSRQARRLPELSRVARVVRPAAPGNRLDFRRLEAQLPLEGPARAPAPSAAHGWWLALLLGLIITVATALTGFADWLTIEWGTELWKTATYHMIAMVSATVFFGLAAIFGHDDFKSGNVTAGPFVLTVVGFGLLTLGGWLGGSVVFVHGMRVLSLVKEPAERAVSPLPKPEKEAAEGS